MSESVTYEDVLAAAVRIAPYVHRTPVLTCESLSSEVGAELFFKCENLQKVGAFKARGAHNAVFGLSEEMCRNGVATHSSGNHGAALALAARSRGIPAHVVVPESAPAVKRAAVERYGASIIECRPTLNDRERTLAEVVDRLGATPVHPYDDAAVIAGQGTAALELIDEIPDLDMVLVPVGGGGLLSGSAIVAKGSARSPAIVGAEPAAADDAWQGFRSGERVIVDAPVTIADGLRASLGKLNFELIRRHVDDIVRVDEAAIAAAMRVVWERMKIVIEPSAAVPVAALLEHEIDVEGQRIGVILSGGNVDLGSLPWSR
jgi:threonine dehydratase